MYYQSIKGLPVSLNCRYYLIFSCHIQAVNANVRIFFSVDNTK